jgi:hypothetical protein
LLGGLTFLGLLPGVLGCSRPPSGQNPQAGSRRPPVSPKETVARLIRAREANDYHGMTPLIVPERAADVVNTLVAVDDFLNASQQLCDLVRREVGLGLAETIDQSGRAQYLDIFSKYVELLDETSTGKTATVSFTVDGQLPARETRLRLVDGTWRYDPGPGDYKRLAEAHQRMARGLRQTIDEIRGGRLSPQELRDQPEKLVEEVRVRLLPGVQLLPAPPSTAPDGGEK